MQDNFPRTGIILLTIRYSYLMSDIITFADLTCKYDMPLCDLVDVISVCISGSLLSISLSSF